jgi:hypothetical protein
MKKYGDDPKGKKKKLFQSSESPSKAQSRAQGPAIAAAVGAGTLIAGALTNPKVRKAIKKTTKKIVQAPKKLVKNIQSNAVARKAKKAEKANAPSFKRRAGSVVPKK